MQQILPGTCRLGRNNKLRRLVFNLLVPNWRAFRITVCKGGPRHNSSVTYLLRLCLSPLSDRDIYHMIFSLHRFHMRSVSQAAGMFFALTKRLSFLPCTPFKSLPRKVVYINRKVLAMGPASIRKSSSSLPEGSVTNPTNANPRAVIGGAHTTLRISRRCLQRFNATV